MCICEKLPQVKLSEQSVLKLLRFDGLGHIVIERRIHIDGSPVVLVAAVNEHGRKVHQVLCAGDVCYRKEKRTLEDGTVVRDRVTHDTYKCPRKAIFRRIVMQETIREYTKHRFSYAPDRLIMDMFARVSRGEYLGEFSAGVLYVQEVAQIFEEVFRSKPGLLSARTYCSLKERKKRYASSRPMFFLYLDLPMDKTIGTLQQDNSVLYAPLTESELRTVAFFEDTQSIVEKLIAAKRLALHGMILCTPFPDELPDDRRTLLPERDRFAVYTSVREAKVLQVQRHYEPEYATLCIFALSDSSPSALLATRVVHLLYGAEFGPDVQNVSEWEECFDHFEDHGFLE